MAQRGSNETMKRKELVGKLNPLCFKALSTASQAAKGRGNPYIELVHFIEALYDSPRSDFEILCFVFRSPFCKRYKVSANDPLRLDPKFQNP